MYDITKRNPLISIIIPVYNTLEYLERCFDSVSAQNYKNIEVLVIDDGSTDGSGDYCDNYAKKDFRFRVIHKDNEGVSKARNTGLDIANGEYIAFVDSDDSVENSIYEVLYASLKEFDADMVICNQTHFTQGKKEKREVLNRVAVLNNEEALEEILLGRAFGGTPWNKLFKKSMVQNIRFQEDVHYAEDLLFSVEVLLNCNKTVYVPEALYNYYDRETSGWKSAFSPKTYTDHIARERIITCVSQSKNSKILEFAHTNLLLCDINLLSKLYYDKNARKEFCHKIQKSMREHFTFKRIKDVTLFQKIGIISAVLSINLYFLLFPVQVKIKEQKAKK